MGSGLFKMLPVKYSFTNHIINMYKQDLALNNQQGLIRHKTQRTNASIKNLTIFTIKCHSYSYLSFVT